jgi:type I restriction enzyme M protein
MTIHKRNNHKNKCNEALTSDALRSHLWKAFELLHGDNGIRTHKRLILALLTYKRLSDVWEEEYEQLLDELGDEEKAKDSRRHRFHIPQGHFWRDVLAQRAIGPALARASRAIEHENIALRGLFSSSTIHI